MKKRVIILGSTGSIGTSALSVLRGLAEEWQVVGLSACTSWEKLASQAEEFQPEAVALTDERCTDSLRRRLPAGTVVFDGPGALLQLVDQVDCFCVVAGVVGTEGLPATIRAAEKGRRIALANKEALVIAGSLLIPMVQRCGCEIIPVDSEHSAVLQAMRAGRRNEIDHVYLTASGGPFRTWSREEIRRATVQDALNHPTWDMGPKITIDSATMMNKALEIVEARWLFDLDPDQIHVVVHPESIIHSWVEFCDGSIIAQLGAPDMRTPIQFALTYPERRPRPADHVSLTNIGQLNLEEPDIERFPAIELGHEVSRRGGTYGAVFNAANEQAVELFRNGTIAFTDITRYVGSALKLHQGIDDPSLDQLLAADKWAREEVTRCLAC